MQEKKEALYKFTLSTKKTVILREPKISHSRTSAQIAGRKAGDNQAHLQMLIQEEVCKALIHSIDDVVLKPIEKENLDNLFSVVEYGQVLKAIQMIGGDDSGEPVMEIELS